jgi:AraC-like DNA-binding protein
LPNAKPFSAASGKPNRVPDSIKPSGIRAQIFQETHAMLKAMPDSFCRPVLQCIQALQQIMGSSEPATITPPWHIILEAEGITLLSLSPRARKVLQAMYELGKYTRRVADHLAGVLKRSPDYVVSLLKAETGRSPYDFMILFSRYWIDRAMQDDKLTISEIAIRCGFSGSNSLCAFMKRWVGSRTPGEYRWCKYRL